MIKDEVFLPGGERGVIAGMGFIVRDNGQISNQYIVSVNGFYLKGKICAISHILVNVENFDEDGLYKEM